MRISLRSPATFLTATVLIGAVLGVPAATAAPAQTDAEAKEVARISAEANRLAATLTEQMSRVDRLDDQIASSEQAARTAEERISGLQARFRERAVILYRRAGMNPLDLESNEDLESVLDAMRVQFFAERSTDEERQDVNELRTISEELREEQDRLAGLRSGVAAERDRLNKANREIQAKLTEARAAQQRAEAARTARAQEQARASAGAPRVAGNSVGAEPGPARTVGGIRCPIAGPVSFRNDWGDARSGGRRHAGTDLFSPEGTPNVAVIGGNVFTQNEGVGGLSVYLQGTDGNTYYYTHLSRYGASGSVSAGEVIGYTGGTGNARGVIHTHFEIRIGGPNGTKVNPYPTLAAVC
jgi:murein DD-endopeptidase MepM/ murein hydrolase activator NlpD